jgi:hypothetical protein
MKKILFGIICILCLVSCEDGSKTRVDKSKETEELTVTVGSYSSKPESSTFKVIWMEGHKYVVMSSRLDSRISGLTHAGSCPCNPNHNYRGQ